MTLHWWMHWFWVTLFHSVVAFPLLLPGTLSAPSQEKHDGIQSPVSSPPPVSGGGASWEPKVAPPIGGVGLLDGTETEKVATGSPPMATNVQRRLAYVSTEGSVIGKEQTSSAKEEADGDESTSESNKEVPLFLEEESDRGWGLDDPAPRPPFFLQSAGLGEGYEEEDEDEGIHASAGVPWLSAAVPRVEIGSASERPTIIPSHEFPSSTVEPLPANLSPEHSAAGESQPDVSEGGESAGRGPREQPQEPNPEPRLNSSPLPEAIVSSETLTSPSSIWTLYSSSSPSSSFPFSFSSTPFYTDSSPTPTYSDSSSPALINSDSSPSPSSSYADSSSSPSPLYSDSSFSSSSQITQTTISDIPPTLSSLLIPSDTLSSDAVHVREGKAIGVSHVDQQPKQEQKQVEVMGGSDVTISTTVRPTKFEVESSPVKSSSNLNATVVAVDEKDGVKKENVTLDSSGPLMDSSSSNTDGTVVEVEEAGEARSPPVVAEEKAKKEDEKEVMGTNVGKEPESKNINSSVVEESGSNASKPSLEEEIISPVEAPTAVAVREGSTSVQNPQSEVTKELDGEGQPSEKVDKNPVTTVADVPSSVHQGRMTAPRSLDAASIVGISLGSVLLVGAVAGGVGFVLYRRSLYANKPQTLNDKCSNPDSSGYIDDTLRENSEEMYSLDNDSFLNSLEAMTIQNYWTDSVKHTKL